MHIHAYTQAHSIFGLIQTPARARIRQALAHTRSNAPPQLHTQLARRVTFKHTPVLGHRHPKTNKPTHPAKQGSFSRDWFYLKDTKRRKEKTLRPTRQSQQSVSPSCQTGPAVAHASPFPLAAQTAREHHAASPRGRNVRGSAERGRVSAAFLCLDVHVPTAGEFKTMSSAATAGTGIVQ